MEEPLKAACQVAGVVQEWPLHNELWQEREYNRVVNAAGFDNSVGCVLDRGWWLATSKPCFAEALRGRERMHEAHERVDLVQSQKGMYPSQMCEWILQRIKKLMLAGGW